MGNVKYRFDRSLLKQLRDQLAGVERSLADCEELFIDIRSDVLVPSASKTFDAGGRPSTWEPLSEAYALRKARRVGHTQVLVWSETLRDSIASESGNQYSVWDTGPHRMLFGTEVPYAAAHQYGYAPNNLPERPFLLIQDEDYDKILDMSMDWLMETGRYASE